MITRDEARDIAIELIRRISGDATPPIQILEEHTVEREFGWVFFYESKEYLKTGNRDKKLLGNAPVLVDRNTGCGLFTGTGYEVEDYIEAYTALGPDRYVTEANAYLRKKGAGE